MPPPLDLTGHVFGRLTVLGRSAVRIPASGRKGKARGWTLPTWECRCQCGTIIQVPTARLTREMVPNTRSCGCLQRDKARVSGQRAASHATPKICRYFACRKAYLGTHKQKYCSPECKELAALAKRDGRCEVCGQAVSQYRRIGRSRLYCTDRCKRDAKTRREIITDAATLTAELQRRLDHAEEKWGIRKTVLKHDH